MIILIINYRTNLLCLRMFYMRSAFLEKAKQDIIRIIRKESIFSYVILSEKRIPSSLFINI